MNEGIRNRFRYIVLAIFAMLAIWSAGAAHAAAQTTDSQIAARSGAYVLTAQDLQEILFVDGCVLQTPLNAVEQQEARQNILGQFQKNPAAVSKGMDVTHKAAEILRHGSLFERTALSTILWGGWQEAAASDPAAARWVAMVKRHNPPIAVANGLVVTKLQLDGMFVSNDWVAQTAGLPMSTLESRAAFARELSSKFASMTQVEKEVFANADRRWLLLNSFLNYSDMRASAINSVHQNVHGPGDVAREARSLENSGLQFIARMQQLGEQSAAIAGISTKGQMNVNSIYMATKNFQTSWSRH